MFSVNIRSLLSILAVKLEREQRSTNAYGRKLIPYWESMASIARGNSGCIRLLPVAAEGVVVRRHLFDCLSGGLFHCGGSGGDGYPSELMARSGGNSAHAIGKS
jgi:hypothetical protein